MTDHAFQATVTSVAIIQNQRLFESTKQSESEAESEYKEMV